MQKYMFYTIQPNLASKKKHMVNDLKQKGDNTYKKNIFLISHTSFSSGGFVIRLHSFIVHRSKDIWDLRDFFGQKLL